MVAGGYFEKIIKKKLRIDLKWREMPAAILKKSFQKKLCIDLKWREMYSKMIFVDPKWPPAAIL